MPSAGVLNFHWTLDSYREVQERSDYLLHVWELGRRILRLDADRAADLYPAAWAMAFNPGKRTKGI